MDPLTFVLLKYPVTRINLLRIRIYRSPVWNNENMQDRRIECDGTCVGWLIHDDAQNPIGYGVTRVRRAVFNCAPV
ncbi:hypothetical protein PUN28_001789 [Cardiocondyla obscurior]|uniref:Uncharacterized protein n=1 Tax=Cardiocondyla obscurior TaxID=286306 RepID=A0AAW2GRC6_9HYME